MVTSWLALLAYSTLLPLYEAKHLTPICSGYCSCRDKPNVGYMGYVDEPEEMKKALEAAAYKKEVR